MNDFLWAMVPFLIPLLFLSVYGVGLIFHKAWQLKDAGPLGPEAFTGLLDAVVLGRRSVPGLKAGHPLEFLLSRAHEGPQVLQARAQGLLATLEDRISYFPALANISTLTGLFGTVCGMIGAFLALRSGGGADPSSLAGGLGTALVATALGLVTAIPSLVAHAVFQKKVQALGGQMEGLLAALLPPGTGESGA